MIARAIVIIVVLVIVWLAAGRHIASLLDHFISIRSASLPVNSLRYDGGGLRIGDSQKTFASTDNLRLKAGLSFDSLNRVYLSWRDDAFALGPRTNPADPSGRPEIDFIPEPEDEVSFITSQSAIGWPTPFEFKIMGGRSPWWKRYVYYRLIWKKASGATLDMRWRYEQHYYRDRGWTKPAMLWMSQTGLVAISIHPDRYERAVVKYVDRTKHWRRNEYRIENRGRTTDGRNMQVAVIHVDDERSPVPGTGRSIQLYLDPLSEEVTREPGGQ